MDKPITYKPANKFSIFFAFIDWIEIRKRADFHWRNYNDGSAKVHEMYADACVDYMHHEDAKRWVRFGVTYREDFMTVKV